MRPQVQLMEFIPIESISITLDALGRPIIRVLDPHLWDTVYISEVNEAKKVKSDAQVAMNKNSHICKKFSLGETKGTVPQLNYFSNFWNCPKQVELDISYLCVRLI